MGHEKRQVLILGDGCRSGAPVDDTDTFVTYHYQTVYVSYFYHVIHRYECIQL